MFNLIRECKLSIENSESLHWTNWEEKKINLRGSKDASHIEFVVL